MVLHAEVNSSVDPAFNRGESKAFHCHKSGSRNGIRIEAYLIMKKLVVSVCILGVAASALSVQPARAGGWGKALAAGAVGLAAGYYLGSRSNRPTTTYVIQQPESSGGYDDGES